MARVTKGVEQEEGTFGVRKFKIGGSTLLHFFLELPYVWEVNYSFRIFFVILKEVDLSLLTLRTQYCRYGPVLNKNQESTS